MSIKTATYRELKATYPNATIKVGVIGLWVSAAPADIEQMKRTWKLNHVKGNTYTLKVS